MWKKIVSGLKAAWGWVKDLVAKWREGAERRIAAAHQEFEDSDSFFGKVWAAMKVIFWRLISPVQLLLVPVIALSGALMVTAIIVLFGHAAAWWVWLYAPIVAFGWAFGWFLVMPITWITYLGLTLILETMSFSHSNWREFVVIGIVMVAGIGTMFLI